MNRQWRTQHQPQNKVYLRTFDSDIFRKESIMHRCDLIIFQIKLQDTTKHIFTVILT